MVAGIVAEVKAGLLDGLGVEAAPAALLGMIDIRS